MAPRKRPAVPRKRPKQSRATATVDVMLQAAERVFERDGLDRLTTNRVAEVAGVSVGSVYQYFPNKEALIAALIERTTERNHESFRQVLALARDVPLDLIIDRLSEWLLAQYHSHGPVARALFDSLSDTGLTAAYRHLLDRYVDDLTTFLSARPDLVLSVPRSTAYVLLHAIHGIIHGMFTTESPIDHLTINREAVRLVRAYVHTLKEPG